MYIEDPLLSGFCFFLSLKLLLLDLLECNFIFQLNRRLFPYFLHPGKAMSLTASIYMVVAIACDRFQAICNPAFYRVSSKKKACYVWSPFLLWGLCNVVIYNQKPNIAINLRVRSCAEKCQLHNRLLLRGTLGTDRTKRLLTCKIG